MLRGMYAAATALDAASQTQEVVAHNLAYSTAPGYRAQGTAFETFDRVLGRAQEPTGDIVGTHVARGYTDFRPGALQATGHPYDLAITNDAFFVLNGPDNQPLYTRTGSFRLTGDGQLQSQGGYTVQGAEGALTLPPGSNVTVGADGSVSVDGNNVGRLRLARFTDPQRLTSVGPTLYRAPQEAGLQQADGGVIQGMREMSNVNPAEAMVKLITGSRYYDAAQRALRAISDSVQLNTRPQ